MPLALLVALLLQIQIPAPTGYVNDFAKVVDPASRAAMQSVIDGVRAACGGEIVVVTLPDIGGRASIDVARDIGRRWKVGAQGAAGDPKRNTGTVLLLVPGGHPGDGKAQLAIATGSGAEGFVTDATAGRIRDAIGRQSVATGSYAQGLVAGVQLLGAAYAQAFDFKLTGAAPPPEPEQAPAPSGRNGSGLFATLLFLFVMLMVMRGLSRRRGGFGGGSGLLQGIILGSLMSGGRRGGWGGGGFGGGGFGGFGGGGGFGGFGGGGGFSGGGASGGF